MPELLEGFAFHHWMDTRTKDETFFVRQVKKVMPKTFVALGSIRFIDEGDRLPRSHVIAAFQSDAEATALGDNLFAIGDETGKAIEAEMYRRIRKFADRKRAASERKIHRLLPHFFGGAND
jgi:hypothetical protein